MSAYADLTLRNSALESPTFGAIAKVNPIGVQWKCLALGEIGVNFSKYKSFFFLILGWINRIDPRFPLFKLTSGLGIIEFLKIVYERKTITMLTLSCLLFSCGFLPGFVSFCISILWRKRFSLCKYSTKIAFFKIQSITLETAQRRKHKNKSAYICNWLDFLSWRKEKFSKIWSFTYSVRVSEFVGRTKCL